MQAFALQAIRQWASVAIECYATYLSGRSDRNFWSCEAGRRHHEDTVVRVLSDIVF